MNARRTGLVLLFALCAAPRAGASLTAAPRLAAVYDTILAAKFDQVPGQLARACPPAPEAACQALAAVSVWWQILLEPESRALDGRLEDLAETAIATSEAWTKRDPSRAEAWFYLAASQAPLVQWRVLRGQRVAAAREGNRIREALERALALDPTLTDAYFGIGLYHYYADVAPAAAKLLRFMLFLPGGDRAKGLQEMLTARDHGEVLRGEADYQLHTIYLWYEHETGHALQLLEVLDQRYPTNPLFLEQTAQIKDTYSHDAPASAAAWQTLLDRARGGTLAPHTASIAQVRARLGLAQELDDMFETDRAVALLEAVVDEAPADPPGALARARAALDRARAKLGVEAYRLSIDGLRALERGALAEAEADLSRAVALAPADLVARYRYARVLERRGDEAGARAEIARVVEANGAAPPIVRASALVDAARIAERDGDRSRALALYRSAVDVVGGDPHAHDDALRAIARLTKRRGGDFFDF